MKNLIIYLFIIISIGCKEEEKEPVDNNIIYECVGASFYYLDNQSNKNFSIEFKAPILNKQIDTATVINVNQRVLIGQDASFGSIPSPTNTFSSFSLSTSTAGKKTIIYRQDPVQNTLWVKRKHNATDPDAGCQKVDYTLTITDDSFR